MCCCKIRAGLSEYLQEKREGGGVNRNMDLPQATTVSYLTMFVIGCFQGATQPTIKAICRVTSRKTERRRGGSGAFEARRQF